MPNIRLRRVWCQDDLLNNDDIVLAIGRGVAELQRRLAGNIEFIAGGDAVLAENAESGGARGKESDDCCGKPHG